MNDGSTPPKRLKTQADLDLLVGPPNKQSECKYGNSCLRKNPQHFKDFWHPNGVSPTVKPATVSTAKAVVDKFDDSALPPCKYGMECYRRNLLHFAEYSHPAGHRSERFERSASEPQGVEEDSGGDTDVFESGSDEEKEKGKKQSESKVKSSLSTGLSLVKKFSMLTHAQRKELIYRAFEEKIRLEKELNEAKKLVADKEKKLQDMKKKVHGGKLLLEGEREAMKQSQTTYFRLGAERAYKEGSPSQIHFRVAESQFYRLLTGQATALTRIKYVEYVVSPNIIKKFRECQERLKTSRGEEFSYPVLGFHGTKQQNITSICENGFRLPGDPSYIERTDCGWYGAGIYFSEYPKYSMKYIQGASKLMLSQVLPGKVYKCPGQIHGAKLQDGFDSHASPNGKELVIFEPRAIRPCYIIHFTTADGDFKYTPSETDVLKDFENAQQMPPSSVFQGTTFAISGKFAVKHADLFQLITSHGGNKAVTTKEYFDVLISTPEDFASRSPKVLAAQSKKALILKADFILQSILSNSKIPIKDVIIEDSSSAQSSAS